MDSCLANRKSPLSSCNGEAPYERRCDYTLSLVDKLLSEQSAIECQSQAKLSIQPDGRMVAVSGSLVNVLAAIRLVESRVAMDEGTKQRRVLESEDSSYDSDYENSESLSPREPNKGLHDDVSRTVSDTLGAEFDEYITQTPESVPGSVVEDPGYTSRVEFGLKLGYTEAQVQLALQKLGPQAGQNELLAELIKLGATGKGARERTDENGMDIARLESLDDSYRHVVIDGSNVAMSHGNKECFSCRGIKLCVEWFRARGHREITVFVPRWRKEASRPDAPIKDQDILLNLEKERLLVFTPSRHVGGRRMVCYDDRYILKLAAEVDGVVVSNDNYRDLLNESPEYKKVVEERLLMYSFVNDRFMPPDDPLGRHGPSLDNLLRKQSKIPETLPPHCPYGKKCTYGNKCKYYHPERGNLPQKSVTERLVEQAKIQLQEVKSRGLQNFDSSSGDKKSQSPLHVTTSCDLSSQQKMKKLPLARTKSLVTSFPGDPFDRTRKDDKGSELLPIGPKLAEEVLSGPPPAVSITVTATESTWGSISHPSSWASMSLTLPQNIPSPRAELFLEPDSGGHLYVAKRLSDPDNLSLVKQGKFPHHSSKDIAQASSVQQGQDDSSANLHRKLQRQLTLNPAYDPRLFHMHGYVGEKTQQDQYERLLLAQRAAGNQDNLQASNLHVANPHRPVARMGSDSRVTQHPKPWDPQAVTNHQNVTRIASAPDSSRQWHPDSAAMQRLSSTSDSRLNAGPHLVHPHASYIYPQDVGATNWLLQPGARQQLQGGMMMPSGSMVPPARTSLWQEGCHAMGMGIGRPAVRPASVPPQNMMQAMSPLATPRAMSPDIQQDNHRSKLYYHLSSIFPEEQVKATMDMYPEETNPQQICAAILAMYSKK